MNHPVRIRTYCNKLFYKKNKKNRTYLVFFTDCIIFVVIDLILYYGKTFFSSH